MSRNTLPMQPVMKALQRKIAVKGDKSLNQALGHFCGDFAEAYRTGVEEAQRELLLRVLDIGAKQEDRDARLGVRAPNPPR